MSDQQTVTRELLVELTRSTNSKKAMRLTEFLSVFENKVADGWWYFQIPDAFKAALDIQQTERVSKDTKKTELVWTQGGNFSFKAGDTLYDHPAYGDDWLKALRKIQICVSVIRAVAVKPAEDTPRDPGRVNFKILKPNENKTKLEVVGIHECTHDEFVEYLIFGPPPAWPQKCHKWHDPLFA